jgi:hypothetical protein
MDINRRTCDIRTWKKHLFLDISSTNTDTLVFTRASKSADGQRPWNGRVQPLLYNRRINKHWFLGNGSIKTFPRQRIRIQWSSYCWNTMKDTVFPIRFVPRCYKQNSLKQRVESPCGGGIEYLHRDPASRRRRQKGESQMRDSKIWSRNPRGSDQRKIALARASSIYKSQTRPLVREGAPQEKKTP